ncbi:MAG: hypothetical protein COT84_07185 [Chlamydiae bacterium CG10_big_fil_rev_8_21_14_0_10_35_9]|nr:MAG: hypothetical protein COT84_07185 [Chlamydiae bacterium CG10_big_fil_rev_8_21_14_0_10_35_9]
MSAIGLSHTSITIDSDRSPGVRLHGDKELTEVTMKEMANFLLNNGNYAAGYSITSLRNLTIKPLSADEIRFGIRVINEHPLLFPNFSNEANTDRSGLIRVTMKRTLTVTELRTLGADLRDVSVFLGEAKRTSIKALTISKNAWSAVHSYLKQLETPVSTFDWKISYHQRYISLPPPREKTCCEKFTDGVSDIVSKCCDPVITILACLIDNACASICCLGVSGLIAYGIINAVED